jgi:hypothetical protein
MKAEPGRHARHAMKVLLKFHLMEEGAQAAPVLMDWALATPLLAGLWERHAPPGVPSPAAWVAGAVDELVAGGALRREGEMVCDA